MTRRRGTIAWSAFYAFLNATLAWMIVRLQFGALSSDPRFDLPIWAVFLGIGIVLEIGLMTMPPTATADPEVVRKQIVCILSFVLCISYAVIGLVHPAWFRTGESVLSPDGLRATRATNGGVVNRP